MSALANLWKYCNYDHYYPNIICASHELSLKSGMIFIAFSLRPIPFYQENCSFQFDVDNKPRRLYFPFQLNHNNNNNNNNNNNLYFHTINSLWGPMHKSNEITTEQIHMLVFGERGKPENQGKTGEPAEKPLRTEQKQQTQPTLCLFVIFA